MRKYIYSLIFGMLVFVTSNSYAQKIILSGAIDSTKLYKIELIDNTVFVGSIIQKDSVQLQLNTATLRGIKIPFKKIVNINEVQTSNVKKGVYWFPNPNATRYLFGPSAFNLRKGEGYYQNTYLFLNSFNVGITDNISIGGGFELLSTFGSLSNGGFKPIFIITPKIGFEVTEKFHAGAGVLYVSIPGFDSGEARNNIGIAYGIGTYGSVDHNVSGGLGWGFFENEMSAKPIITISGMTRVSKNVGLITENWIISGASFYTTFSYGVRFFGEKLAVDIAFLNNSDIAQGLFIGIPYVDFVVKF